MDRDINAAINIKNIAVGRTVIKAQRVTEPIGGVAEKPALYS
jgi:transposase